jgi:hypothetical protein
LGVIQYTQPTPVVPACIRPSLRALVVEDLVTLARAARLAIIQCALLVLFLCGAQGGKAEEIVLPNVANGIFPYVIAAGEQTTNPLVCFTLSESGYTAPRAVFWRGNLATTTTLPLSVPADDFTLVSNSLVTASFKHPTGITVSEYSMGFANDLPIAFTGTNSFVFGNDKTRQPKLIRTTRGGVFIIAYRHDYSTGMDFDCAYRFPDGRWQISHVVPEPSSLGIPSKFYDVAEGFDGKIYVFVTRDSSAQVHLIRFDETPEGVRYSDYNNTFVQGYTVNGVAVDGDMAPHGELPWPVAVRDPFNHTLKLEFQNATYAGSWSSFSTSHPVLIEVNTFTVPPPVIVGVSKEADHAKVRWTSVSNSTYVLSQSSDLSKWREVVTGIYGEAGIVSSGNTTEYTVPCTNQTAFFSVKTRGYTKKLIGVAPQFIERIFSYTPMFPKPDGLYFLFNEVIVGEAGSWKLNKFDYATGLFGTPVTVITNVAQAHCRLAWGAGIPYVAWQDITDLKLHIRKLPEL